MAKALISKIEVPQHISSWQQIYNVDKDTPVDENTPKSWDPVYTDIPNAYRVSEVRADEFEVHPSFFWVDCDDTVVADDYYYDHSDSTIKEITHAPQPE